MVGCRKGGGNVSMVSMMVDLAPRNGGSWGLWEVVM